MRSCFHALLVVAFCLQYSAGVTAGNSTSSQLNTVESMPNTDPYQYPTNTVISDGERYNMKSDDLEDTRVVKHARVVRVIRKRIASALLNLAGPVLDVFAGPIKNLFGMSRSEVETNGLTQAQVMQLLMAATKMSCSGAAGLPSISVTFWQITSVVTLSHLFRKLV